MTPALALSLLLAASPFKAEQPSVREGNEKLLSGDAAGALEQYRVAEQEAGPHPEIDYDRGNALHALGRHAEAREAWKQALERDRAGVLSSRALQNMGNALAAAGDREGAVKAFSQALGRDPANEDARYNLEVLLRRKAEGKGAPKDSKDSKEQQEQQDQEGKQDQQGKQEKQDQAGQKPEPKPGEQGQPKDQGQDQAKGAPTPEPGKQGERKDEAKGAGQPEDRKQGEPPRGEPASARQGPLDAQDAERLLDALRARERNMPLGPAGRKEARKRDVVKDW